MRARLLWLGAVPFGSSLLPWALLLTLDDSSELVLWIVFLAPLVGAVCSAVYAVRTHGQVHWWPLAPYALATLCFLATGLLVVDPGPSADGLEGMPAVVVGIFQPLLALVGGLVSFAWVPRRARPQP